MAYQKKFTKPFPGGYRDFPDESTIITASVMDNYDQTLEDFDTEFESIDGKIENLNSAFSFDESGNPTGVEVAGDVVANGVSLIETKEAVSANEANISDINSSLTNVENRVTSVEKKATDNADEIVRVDGRVDELKGDLDKIATISNNVISSASFSDNHQVSNSGGLVVQSGYTVCEFDAIKGQVYTVSKVENTYLSINYVETTWATDFANKYEWVSYDSESKTLTFTIPLNSQSNGHVMLSMLMDNKESAYIAKGAELKRTEIICNVPYIDEQISDIYSKIKSAEDKYTILCYGDSLTMGAGGNGTTYPSVLQTLLGENYTVNNYGVGGETAQQIACRQGGVPMMVQPLECPYNTWAEISFKSIFGFEPQHLFVYQSNAGFNPCTIDGKNVTLYWNSDNKQIVRNENSETLSVTRPTKIIPYSSTLKDKICLIWIGTNGWGDSSIDTLINTIKCMIEYNGNEQYIVIGLHKDSLSSQFAELETKMVQSFGEHFINIREYLINYGLSDTDITPTTDDETRISQGLVPSSLLADGLHFNAYGYEVIANVVYKKGKDLGIW